LSDFLRSSQYRGTFCISPIAVHAIEMQKKMSIQRKVGRGDTASGLSSGGFERGTFFVSPIAVPAIEMQKKMSIHTNKFADAHLLSHLLSVPRVGLFTNSFLHDLDVLWELRFLIPDPTKHVVNC